MVHLHEAGEQTGDAHEYLFWLNNQPDDAVRRHLIAVRWQDFRLYKKYAHEGGIATPFVVHWPDRINEPGIVDRPSHIVDVMASCVSASGNRRWR